MSKDYTTGKGFFHDTLTVPGRAIPFLVVNALFGFGAFVVQPRWIAILLVCAIVFVWSLYWGDYINRKNGVSK